MTSDEFQAGSPALAPLALHRRGAGRPLLLVHGFQGAAADWVHVFPEPPGAGSSSQPGDEPRELIEVDLPGHGRSSADADGRFRFRRAAERLAATLEGAELAAVDAIGLSGGALTLLLLAQRHPRLLRRVVAVSATPYFPPQARDFMAAVDPEEQSEADWQAMRARHPGGDAQIRRLWQCGRDLGHSHRDVELGHVELRRIATPFLLVHGDRDPLYPLPLALQLYEGLADARLWVVPEGGHGPIFGSQAPPFRRAALEFLGAAGSQQKEARG